MNPPDHRSQNPPNNRGPHRHRAMTSPTAADPRQRLAWDHPAAQLAQDMPRTSCPYCGAFQAGRDVMAAHLLQAHPDQLQP